MSSGFPELGGGKIQRGVGVVTKKKKKEQQQMAAKLLDRKKKSLRWELETCPRKQEGSSSKVWESLL